MTYEDTDGSGAMYLALAKAQAEFPEIRKSRIATVRTKTGGEFKFKYADLSDVLAAVRAPLAKNGLAVSQDVRGSHVVTTLYHESGAILEGQHPIHEKSEGRMHPAQEYAIAIMYARRYGLTALLGIAADESMQDDRNRMVSETFEDPDRDGVISVRGANVAHDSTPADRAQAYAEAIIAQFADVKTAAGLNGVWDRNQKVLDRLQDSYDAEYQNVLDAYQARGEALNEGANT